MRRIRKQVVLIGAAATAVCAAAGVAYATPGADGKVHACYAMTNGLLLGIPHSKGDTRIVDSGEACRSYETAISWSLTGEPGPAGPTGATGPAGPAGPPGPATLPRSRAAFKRDKVDIDAGDGTPVLSLALPAGSWAIVAKTVGAETWLTCELRDVTNDKRLDITSEAINDDKYSQVPLTMAGRVTVTDSAAGGVYVACWRTDLGALGWVHSTAILATEIAPF